MDTLTILSIVLVFLICLLGCLLWMAWTSIAGAPWVPTPNKRVRAMLEIAKVGPDDILYDLGCGDGRIIIMAAKEFGAQSIGIELDPVRIRWSRSNIRRKGLEQSVKVVKANFFDVNLEDATVVTIYQTAGVNNKLREKFETELKPGTRVVSYRFIFDGWVPEKEDVEASTYLYIMG